MVPHKEFSPWEGRCWRQNKITRNYREKYSAEKIKQITGGGKKQRPIESSGVQFTGQVKSRRDIIWEGLPSSRAATGAGAPPPHGRACEGDPRKCFFVFRFVGVTQSCLQISQICVCVCVQQFKYRMMMVIIMIKPKKVRRSPRTLRFQAFYLERGVVLFDADWRKIRNCVQVCRVDLKEFECEMHV